MNPKFKVVYTEEAYEFIYSLPEKVQDKIAYNITKSTFFMDKELFKKLDNSDIWEFRTLYSGTAYRLLAFWDTDKDTLVITLTGLSKRHKRPP